MTIFEDDAPHVLGAIITLMILAYGTYALRVYVRIGKTTWGSDDWVMTFAIVSPKEQCGQHRIPRGLN